MPLFFDTETSGFYDKKAPPNAPQQPYIVQFAAILDDDEGNIKGVVNFRVNSGVKDIAEGALKVHKITIEETQKYGVSLNVCCAVFSNFRKMSSRVIAHNVEFDMNVMAAQFARLEKDFNIAEGVFCTMRASSFVLKLPGQYGKFKWPKLSEAYENLIDKEGFAGAHDAFEDVKACRSVYYKLRELGYAD